VDRRDLERSSACDGKTGFLSWDVANRALKAHRRKRTKNGQGYVAPYRCRHCSTWHLGHSVNRLFK